MTSATRRLRSLLIALGVLAVSATVALAGRSALAPDHHAAAQNEQGEQAEGTEALDADAPEAPEQAEVPGGSEASDDSDSTTEDSAAVHPDNHGKLVSEAAKGETPDGFDNHGAYVRTIAHDNHGHSGDAAKPAKIKSH